MQFTHTSTKSTWLTMSHLFIIGRCLCLLYISLHWCSLYQLFVGHTIQVTNLIGITKKCDKNGAHQFCSVRGLKWFEYFYFEKRLTYPDYRCPNTHFFLPLRMAIGFIALAVRELWLRNQNIIALCIMWMWMKFRNRFVARTCQSGACPTTTNKQKTPKQLIIKSNSTVCS